MRRKCKNSTAIDTARARELNCVGPPTRSFGGERRRVIRVLLKLLMVFMVVSVLAGDVPRPPAAEPVLRPLPTKWKQFELCKGFKHLAK